MEAMGLGVAVASLPAVFTSCISCFELTQPGRNFGEDYEKCVLRLDFSRARRVRWGQSIGQNDTFLRVVLMPQTKKGNCDEASQLYHRNFPGSG